MLSTPANRESVENHGSHKHKAPIDDNGDPVKLKKEKVLGTRVPKKQNPALMGKAPAKGKAAPPTASSTAIPTKKPDAGSSTNQQVPRRSSSVEIEDVFDEQGHVSSLPPRNPRDILELVDSGDVEEDDCPPPPAMNIDAIEEDDEAELKRLLKEWTSPVYVFFRRTPRIEYKGERRFHVFECAAARCKARNGRDVRRFLDTSDAKSTSNMRKHAKICWGDEAVAAADATKDLDGAREILAKSKLRDGSITAEFERIGNRQHPRTEARVEIVHGIAESSRDTDTQSGQCAARMGTRQLPTASSKLDGKDPQESLFIFIYENKRKLTDRPSSHAEAVSAVMELFPDISSDGIVTFHTDALPICRGKMTEVSPTAWDKVIRVTDTLTVMVETHGGGKMAPLFVKTQTGKTISLTVPSSLTVASLKGLIQDKEGIPAEQQRLTFEGQELDEVYTLRRYGVMESAVIHLIPIFRGRKPVIYLFAPEAVEAIVKLSLVRQWSLSAIYPVVSIKPGTDKFLEEVVWKVHVNSSTGTLTEQTTGLEVAYLFWEATTKHVPLSPPASPLRGTRPQEVFDPSNPVVNAMNSVVIPIEKITLYLDKVLIGLCLHTEARTSFISFWLPDMLKYKYVALRFLPQNVYENAAPLEVTPRPDIITRVYMIFQGVAEEELSFWDVASRRGTEETEFWTGVVGVDKIRAEDSGLFRVLEWGGMEVPSHSRNKEI